MKFSKLRIVIILLVIGTIVFSGCTDSAPSEPSVTTPQTMVTITKTIPPHAITTARQPVTTVEGMVTENPVRVFLGDYHWVEYRENDTVTMPPNPGYQSVYVIRMERSTGIYESSTALHYKVTTISDYVECCINNVVTTTKDGRIAVSDTYYDISTNEFLGGNWTETIKGVLKYADYSGYYAEISRDDKPDGEMGITPFGEMNITLTDKGTESITVPAGTYPNARKYTGNFRDGTPITFWVTPGIPVPVLYQFPNKYLDGVDPFQSYELKGWG